ncbi:MAG TPA: hypothetical protein VHC97_24165 [Thermoanaerobaculia bacterium]|nr:hypothetical protein [Thermoanaerobaculia bacterium]
MPPLTEQDYWRAVDACLAGLGELGDTVKGVVLWGSLARGETVPGRSDLLDAVVVLRRGALEGPEEHRRVLETLADACAVAARGGAPFSHPFSVFREEEIGDLESLYLPTLASGRSSRVIAGEDVRPAMACDAGARAVARCAFFAMRRRFLHPLAGYLEAWDLSAEEREMLFQRLNFLRKALPVLACAALGLPSDEAVATAELRQVAGDPGLFDEFAAIRRGERPLGGAEELRGLLLRGFELVEALNERISQEGCWNEFFESVS